MDVNYGNLKIERDAIYRRDQATGLKTFMGYEERVVIEDAKGNKAHVPKAILDKLDGREEEEWEGQGFDVKMLKKAKVVK